MASNTTHLAPRYVADWGDGQIHLEGELDYPVDLPARRVYDSFRARSELIGAIVNRDLEAGFIRAYPWNGPGHFRLHFDPDDPEALITEISVHDVNGDEVSRETVEELIEAGEEVAKVKECINDVRILTGPEDE